MAGRILSRCGIDSRNLNLKLTDGSFIFQKREKLANPETKVFEWGGLLGVI